MAEGESGTSGIKVGEIFYEVSLDTAKMLGEQRQVDKVLGQATDAIQKEDKAADQLQTSLTAVAQAAKTHVAQTQVAAVAIRDAAKATADAAAANTKAGDAAKKGAAELGKQAISAKQLSAAMRGVPAQFTDIATALASGQNPLTVFLQQGGQLKDMFGGLVPAAKALGSYVLGLVNPFTVAGAAAVAFLVGLVKGSEEMQDFNRALVLSGNAAGVTRDQLNTLAQQMDSIAGVTRSQAASALTVFAELGTSGADNIGKFTEAALRLEQAGGPAVEETAKRFKDLERSPLQAALRLNDSVNFLTESTYRQIRALEQQGKLLEAAKVAQNAYADAILTRTPQVVENIGFIERAWRAVKNGAKEGWDAILGIGRSQTPEDALDGTRQRIVALQKVIDQGGYSSPGSKPLSEKELEGKKAVLAALQEQVRLAERSQTAAQGAAKADADRQNRVEAMAAFDQAGDRFLTDRQRMEQEISRARELGAAAGLKDEQIQQRIAAIRRSFKVDNRRLEAQAYYEGIVAESKSARDRIDAEEQKALTENAKRMADDAANHDIYEKAKVAITAKYARERAIIEEKEQEAVADLSIAMTTDQMEKVEAIRAESVRRAEANEKLGLISHEEAERQKTLATFNAGLQRTALAEKLTQTAAETVIAATQDELTKIELIRQEAFRRAEAQEKAGEISHAQAEANKARATVDAQNAIQQQLYKINPIAQLAQEYEQKLAIVQTYEQLMAQAGIDARLFSEQAQTEITREYEAQRLALAEQSFRSQSDSNAFLIDSINAMASAADTAIVGLLQGTKSVADVMRSLGNVILNEAVHALVQVGVQYLKNALLEKTIGAAKASAYTAAVSAQVGGMAALAAENAFAATAAIPFVGPALAPEAAAAAALAAAALGAPAVASAPVAGARQYGGSVNAGSLYRINEKGMPEMYTAANGDQYMLPTKSGNVTAADKVGAGSPQWKIEVHNNAPGATATASVNDEARVVTIAINEIANQFASNSGPAWSALRSSSNVTGRM